LTHVVQWLQNIFNVIGHVTVSFFVFFLAVYLLMACSAAIITGPLTHSIGGRARLVMVADICRHRLSTSSVTLHGGAT